LWLKSKINQRVQRRIASEIHTAAIAAITAIRAAQFDIFFSAKTKTAIAPFTSVNPDGCFVYKSHNGFTLTRITDKKKPCQ
jgi:hypothetical protein